MILLNIITCVVLFTISTSIPLFSFVLPAYKLKKYNQWSIKEILIVNIGMIVVLGLLNVVYLSIYFSFFFIIELFYLFFKKIATKVKKFDRIVIVSIVLTILAGIALHLLHIDGNKIAILENEISTQLKSKGLTGFETNEYLNLLKENILLICFIFFMYTNFFLTFVLEPKTYGNWKISFELLLIYIVPFFIGKIFKINNFYLTNIKGIGIIIFTFYGIQKVYMLARKFIKLNFINNLIAFTLALNIPLLVFFWGVVGAFFEKEKNKSF